eukprot:comp22344_c0_seq1/m.33245 comp22344_c0_seq1/g.33245  ORF comp22344_c0_seq1/g.33245 comp22344_c0_seq1/m.33245 type:complete len:161 (-) comp22344_c0_seq1:90-572(-)
MLRAARQIAPLCAHCTKATTHTGLVRHRPLSLRLLSSGRQLFGEAEAPADPPAAPVQLHRKRVPTVPMPRDTLDGTPMTVERFLSTIGRGAGDVASKFGSWEELFSSDLDSMRAKDVPVAVRRHILTWTEKYRLGLDPRPMPKTGGERKQAAKQKKKSAR